MKRQIDKEKQTDRLFIQEIINDLERNGYQERGKAWQMLRDWSSELKIKSHSTGRTKKLHAELVGKENY